MGYIRDDNGNYSNESWMPIDKGSMGDVQFLILDKLNEARSKPPHTEYGEPVIKIN